MSGSSSMANLPFKPGQSAEEKSFQCGYRGAWFRCKIRGITDRHGVLGHIPEYDDFPGHKSQWTKLYKVNTKGYPELMLRPAYPPCHNEKQMPHIREVSEVTVIVSDSWKVGDLVDWWNSYSFWCGRITELHGGEEAQVKLKRPPLGEGESYRVHFKDLRPSLDWSPEHGWTLPTQEDGTGPPSARLIKPHNQVIHRMIRIDDTNNEGQGSEGVPRPAGLIARSSVSSPALSNSAVSSELKSKKTTKSQSSSRGTTLPKKPEDDIEKRSSQECGDSNIRKKSQSDADSEQNCAEREAEVVEDNLNRTKSRQNIAEQEVKVVEDDLNHTDSGQSTAEEGMIRVDYTYNEGQGSEDALIATSSLSSPVLSNSAVSSELKSKKTTKKHRYSRGTKLSKSKDDIGKSSSQGCGDSNNRKRSRAHADSKQSSAEQEVEVLENNLNHAESRQNTVEQEVEVVDDDLSRTDSGQSSAEQEADAENNLDHTHYGVNGGAVPKSKDSNILEAAILDLEEYLNKVKMLKKLLLGGISASENQGPQWEFNVSEIPK